MDMQELIKGLIDNRMLRTETEIERFERIIATMVSLKDINHIKYLCLGFDDLTKHQEVTFGLVHAIESYDKDFGMENSLEKLAEAVPSFFPHAKQWAKLLHKRILNDEQSRKIYAKLTRDMDQEIRLRVIQLVEEIRDKNPKKFGLSASEFLSDINH